MSSFTRPASADYVSRSPRRLVRSASVRETGSPGMASSTSGSDGGASLGTRLGNMNIRSAASAEQLSFADTLRAAAYPRGNVPAGRAGNDDPFGGYTEPQGYTHEPRRRERYSSGTVDAQEFYPASACVFVANLPEGMDNIDLETEINDKFSEFGVVFVKIRRDVKNMPFAFCQYTNDRDAAKARVNGAGTLISNRPCRTEMVRANRTFILRNYVGGEVTVEEARSVLKEFGPIGKIEELSPEAAESLGIRQGIIVEFKNFDPRRDIQASFRHHAIYRVIAHDVHRSRKADPTTNSDQLYHRRYDVDRRSIFIGNLPGDVDGIEREVRDLAEEIGQVLSVQVIRKEGRPGYGVNVFAFVEYARAGIAELAVRDLAGRRVFGCRLRVERKETPEAAAMNRRARALDFPPHVSHVTSPARRLRRDQPYTPQREERVGNGIGNIHSASATMTMPMHPVASPLPTWFPYGSTGYPTAPYMPTSIDGHHLPHPHYLPPSMAWAAPYMHDPNMAPHAYWTAWNYAHGAPVPATPTRRHTANEEGNGAAEEPRPNDA